MAGWTDIKKWFLNAFPAIPDDLQEDYQVEAQGDNAKRAKILSGIFIVISLVLLFLTNSLSGHHDLPYRRVYVLVNAGLLIFSVVVFVWGYFASHGVWDIPTGLTRIIVLSIAAIFVLWASWMYYADSFGFFRGWFYLSGVFLVYSLLLFSFREIVILSSLVIIGQFLLPHVNVQTIEMPGGFKALSQAILLIASVLSRVLHFSHTRNYLNWENIKQMNLTLKHEVGMHLSTTHELEQIRHDLDKKVLRQTKHLREANQRLSEEIADRRYADKVRGILYRISSFVNRHHELEEVFEYIHLQLDSIMEVRNFYIGQFIEQDYSIRTVFKVSGSDLDLEDSKHRSLCSFVVRQKESVLLDKKSARFLEKSDEIKISGVLANSWLGVPLKVDNRIVGVLVVASYSENVKYDQTDLELLEYVSEHLALAMARKQSEDILIGAKEKAEESDQLKSAFLSNLSHEIRTPMNAIVGFAELIGSSDLNEKDRTHYSKQVVDNSHNLLKLISNIIELSKIRSGQILVKPVDNVISSSLQNLMPGLNDLKSGLKKQDLSIDLEIDAEIVDQKFSADPERFKQIMLCLVENGLKFTNHGGVSIRVQAYDSQYIQFSVQDSGIGMDQLEINKIFEWFRQGTTASQDLYRGMGLGLTLAKLLIDVMGGTIWVETKLGSGSCFLFTLPLAKDSTTIELPFDPTSDKPEQIATSHRADVG
ncbi:MAG: GAF domain-containing protein [Bacteroidales bacterium]|nr:GAF domain-containing protein [Bacteroidales bacterium]